MLVIGLIGLSALGGIPSAEAYTQQIYVGPTTCNVNNDIPGVWLSLTNTCTLLSDFTVQPGVLLYIGSGYTLVTYGFTIYNYGTIEPASGSALDLALFYNGGELLNYGAISYTFGGTSTSKGVINNYGTISFVACVSCGLNNEGTINNYGLINDNSGGIVSNSGSIYNSGTININDGGTMYNYFSIENSGVIDINYGLVGGGILANSAVLTNENGGIININGGSYVAFGDISNALTIENAGTININGYGAIYDFNAVENLNGGTINVGNSATLVVEPTGSLVNDDGSIIHNSGTIDNYGKITNQCGGVIAGFSGYIQIPCVTMTTITATPDPGKTNHPLTITITVANKIASGAAPQGEVNITLISNAGISGHMTCTLSGSGSQSSCSVTVTPKSVGGVIVLALYRGDAGHKLSYSTAAMRIIR